MLEITPTGQFKKDFKTCKKRDYDMDLLQQIIDILAIPASLPEKNKDLQCIGGYHQTKEKIKLFQFKSSCI